MKKGIVLLLILLLTVSCNNDDDNVNLVLEVWELEAIIVEEEFDFNNDGVFSGNLSDELSCSSFDTYTLYDNGVAVESITGNLALYNDGSDNIMGICESFEESDEGLLNWSVGNGTRNFSFQGEIITATVEDDTMTFEEIDFSIFTDDSLNQLDMAIPATFIYRRSQ